MTKTKAPKTTEIEVSTKTWKIVAQFDEYDNARIFANTKLDENFLKGIDYKIKRSRKTGRFSVRTVVTTKKTTK